jgi:hypothetical protein
VSRTGTSRCGHRHRLIRKPGDDCREAAIGWPFHFDSLAFATLRGIQKRQADDRRGEMQ